MPPSLFLAIMCKDHLCLRHTRRNCVKNVKSMLVNILPYCLIFMKLWHKRWSCWRNHVH